MTWAMAAGGSLAIPFALLLDTRPAPITAGVAMWCVAAAIAGVVAYVGLFFAFANESLTIAVPLVSSWPLLAGVVSVLFFDESLGGFRVVGAALVLVGVILVSFARPASHGAGVDAASARTSRIAFVAGLASSTGFGVMVPAMARIAPATGAFGATVLVFALGIAIAMLVGKLARIDLHAPPRSAWALVLATGAVETLGFVAVSVARRFAPMTLVAPVASLSSTLTVLYAWAVLKERPHPLAIVGAFVAGAGVVILAA